MLFAATTLKTLTILSFCFHLFALRITYRVSADVSDQLIFESPNSGLYRQSHYRDLTAGFMMVPLVIAAKIMDANGEAEEAHLLYWTRLLVRAAWMSFYLMAMIMYQHLSRRFPSTFANVTSLHHALLKVGRIVIMRWISESWLYDEILTRSITTVPAALVFMSPRSFSMPELAILGPAMMLLICDWAGRIANLASSFVFGQSLFTRPIMPLPLSGFSDFLAPILLLFCISQLDVSPKWLRPRHTSLLFAILILIVALANANHLHYISLSHFVIVMIMYILLKDE